MGSDTMWLSHGTMFQEMVSDPISWYQRSNSETIFVTLGGS